MKRAIRVGPALALVALVVAGCGKVIDDEKAEDALQQDFKKSTGIEAKSVQCPGDVDVNTGDTFDCVVQTAKGKATVTLKILNEDADVKVTDVKTSG